jgi:hypothetical protein
MPFEGNLSARGIQQANRRFPESRLTATGFTHQPKRLSGIDIEADPIDRLYRSDLLHHQATPNRKMLAEIFDFKEFGRFVAHA